MNGAPVRCAVYARRSTEQEVAADAKSVTRQIELARAFAQSTGWDVVAEFADDGVSGRLATKLVQRNRMQAAALNDEFRVLVVRDLDRLSRNDEELPRLLATLRDAGVEIWCYSDGQRVDTSTALARLTVNIKSFAASHEAEASSKRTREQKRERYARTANADGRVYGYRNVGAPNQRHREVDPAQAEVVRRIFEMAVAGKGLLRIAKALNADGILSPAGKGWATTGIREMLRRDLYRGVSVYGKTRWEWRHGGKVKVEVPEAQWLRVEAPELRIVDETLWQQVQARLARTRQTYPGRRHPQGGLLGRHEPGLDSQHLLSGFLRCGGCGGNMFVTQRSGRGGPKRYYVCTTHHKRGNTCCTNRWGLPYDTVTRQVCSHFSDLTMEKTLELVRAEEARRIEAFEAQHGTRAATEAEIERLSTELGRLARAVAAGGEIEALVQLMQQTQRRREALVATLAAAERSPEELERCVVAAWKEFSTAFEWPPNGPRARQVLRAILREPLTITPVVTDGVLREWEYLGLGVLDRAVAGRMRSSVTKAYATELVPPG